MLVCVMVYHLFSVRPLPEQLLTYWELDPQEEISVFFFFFFLPEQKSCIQENVFENVICKMAAICLSLSVLSHVGILEVMSVRGV